MSKDVIALAQRVSEVYYRGTLPAQVEEVSAQQDKTTEVTENIQPMATEKSGDTYFPIEINLPDKNTTPVNTTNTISDSEKKKRVIIGAGIILTVIVLIIVLMPKNK